MNTIILYTRKEKYKEFMINYYQKFLFPNYMHVTKEPASKITYLHYDICLISNHPSKIFPLKMFTYVYYITKEKLELFLGDDIAYDFDKLLKNKLLLSL